MSLIQQTIGWAILMLIVLVLGLAVKRAIWPVQPQLLIEAKSPARCLDPLTNGPARQFPQTPSPFAVEIRA